MADYPAHLARERRLSDGRTVLIRPIRADDEAAEREFFQALSDASKKLRFLKYAESLNDTLIHFFTHIDYERHMAFVCVAPGEKASRPPEAGEEHAPHLVGEARYVANPDGRSCEFGVVIDDRWHGSGIAALLMEALIRAARARRLETMEGLVLRQNAEMLHFIRTQGFEILPDSGEPAMVRVVKKL